MDEKTLRKYFLFCEDAVISYPFDKDRYGEMPIFRHKSNKKWFGIMFYMNGKMYINLKCNPFDAVILREQNDFITPAWHMNKKHWIKVEVNKAPLDLLQFLIESSFNLTK